MAKYEIIVTDRAQNSLCRIVRNLKKVSLIGGEDARTAILTRVKKLGANPMANSEGMFARKLDGEYRVAEVWGFLLFYKVEEHNIIWLEVLQATGKGVPTR